MRMPQLLPVLAVLGAMALSPWVAHTAAADGPTEGATQTVLEALPPAHEVSGRESAILLARLSSSTGQALGGMTVTFYVLTDVFGDRLMRVGGVLTDATGTASLVYKPTWVGDHTVVVRFSGNSEYLPAQNSFRFSVTGPVPVHEDAAFGLEPVRRWLPLVMGMVVLAVWGTLGLVMVRTVLGMQGAAATAEPVPMPVAEPARPAPLRRASLLVAALMLLALPIAWLLTREGSKEVHLSTERAWFTDQYGLETAEKPAEAALSAGEKALPATLVRSIPAIATDARGRITPDSPDLPADVAVIKDRVFILDTNKGRILAVTQDGTLAPILETDRFGDMSLWGATAMTAHDGRLYVASPLGGDVVVVSPSGRIEGVIRPQVPEGQRPLRPAGIAVTAQGEIWLSDSNNHRVLLLNAQGEFLGVIGEGVPSSGEYGFDTPGGLALDREGNLRVVDTLNRQVKKYSPMGVFLMAMGEDRLVQPKALAVDGAGNIFVSDDKLQAVLVFGPDGSYLGSIGREGAADEERLSWLQAPHGVHIEGDLVYVMDRLAGLFVFQLGEGNVP